ncbi:MAG: glycerophosphodiester phosphodiesterase family protein [Gemmatimonadota bacterium]|nr:glycerophosphodiester phosphodiesterase family protein [Gemmatimonadota bacterium]
MALHDLFLDPTARPVIAHRGASGLRPENTLTAFALALELGADGIELDVRISRDGVPVVHHDPDLTRTTGRAGLVRELTAGELAAADAGDGEGIPALATVLEATGNLPLLIELKEVAAGRPVLEVLRHCGAASRVAVASFLPAALHPFRGEGVPLGATRPDIIGATLAAAVRWRPRRVPWQFYAVPDRYRDVVTVPTARFVARAHRQGCPVHVWTVDDPERAAALWRIGVSGIITNRPDLIRPSRAGTRP